MKESQKAIVEEIVDQLPGVEAMLVASSKKEFRACKGQVQFLHSGAVRVTKQTALALGVDVNDSIRFVAMRASRPAEMEGKGI